MLDARLGAMEQLLAGLGEQMGMPPSLASSLNPLPTGQTSVRHGDDGAPDGSPGPSLAPSPPPPAHRGAAEPASLLVPACALPAAASRGEALGSSSQDGHVPHR